MSGKTLIGLAIAGSITYFLLSRKSLVKNARFSFQKMSINWKQKQILIGLGVQNPTSNSITINAISGELLVNGNSLASIESNTIIRIAAKGNSIIPLILKPSLIGLFAQIKALLQKNKDKKKQSIAARFVGTANLSGLMIPLDLPLI